MRNFHKGLSQGSKHPLWKMAPFNSEVLKVVAPVIARQGHGMSPLHLYVGTGDHSQPRETGRRMRTRENTNGRHVQVMLSCTQNVKEFLQMSLLKLRVIRIIIRIN